jgi:hypothetical protein
MAQTWLKLPDVQFEPAAGLAGIVQVLAGGKGAMIGQDRQ